MLFSWHDGTSKLDNKMGLGTKSPYQNHKPDGNSKAKSKANIPQTPCSLYRAWMCMKDGKEYVGDRGSDKKPDLAGFSINGGHEDIQ